jgi:hypothetical protein
MLRKAYKTIVVLILAGSLAAACTPGAVDEAPRVIEIETPTATVEDQDLNETVSPPIIPETGGQELDLVPTVTEAASGITPEVPEQTTGNPIGNIDNLEEYEEFYGMPVYDIDGNYLGILEHVVEGPRGLSDFALVFTSENLYRTLPISAIDSQQTADSLVFEDEMYKFMGSPTFQEIEGLNFNLEFVREAVIGYWQHQVDIQAPQP